MQGSVCSNKQLPFSRTMLRYLFENRRANCGCFVCRIVYVLIGRPSTGPPLPEVAITKSVGHGGASFSAFSSRGSSSGCALTGAAQVATSSGHEYLPGKCIASLECICFENPFFFKGFANPFDSARLPVWRRSAGGDSASALCEVLAIDPPTSPVQVHVLGEEC